MQIFDEFPGLGGVSGGGLQRVTLGVSEGKMAQATTFFERLGYVKTEVSPTEVWMYHGRSETTIVLVEDIGDHEEHFSSTSLTIKVANVPLIITSIKDWASENSITIDESPDEATIRMDIIDVAINFSRRV